MWFKSGPPPEKSGWVRALLWWNLSLCPGVILDHRPCQLAVLFLKTLHYLSPGLLKIKCSLFMEPWSFYIRHPQKLSFQQKQCLAYQWILLVYFCHWLTTPYSVSTRIITLKGTPRPSRNDGVEFPHQNPQAGIEINGSFPQSVSSQATWNRTFLFSFSSDTWLMRLKVEV